MIVTVILCVLAVFFAYLAKFKNMQYSLLVSFTLIFLFLAFRFNFGNDYKAYLEGFIEINKYRSIDFFNSGLHFEPGWILLCRLFEPLGFFSLIIFLSLINCIVYYKLVKRYVPKHLYWFAVFLYVFNTGIMLVHASAIRQSLAIGLFMFAIPYLIRKDFIRYFAIVFMAYFVHTSAMILVPIALLSLYHLKINKLFQVILAAVFVSLIVFGQLLLPFITKFVSANLDRYEFYHQGSEIGTGLGLLMVFFLLIVTAYYHNKQNKSDAVLFKIVMVYLMLAPLGLTILMIARVGMYFEPVTIVVYPLILYSIENKFNKLVFKSIVILFTLYIFYQFFESPIWKDAFGTYHSIFEAPKFY